MTLLTVGYELHQACCIKMNDFFKNLVSEIFFIKKFL